MNYDDDYNAHEDQLRRTGGPCPSCVLENLTQVEAALTKGVTLSKRGKAAALPFLLKAQGLTQALMMVFQAIVDEDEEEGVI
jgi:hypothetical protein